MGFEPTTLRGLVGCSNHWAAGYSIKSSHTVKPGQARMAHNCIMQSHKGISQIQPSDHQVSLLKKKNMTRSPLLAIEYPVTQWLEHPTRSRRVVGWIPHGARTFSEFPFDAKNVPCSSSSTDSYGSGGVAWICNAQITCVKFSFK